MYGGGPCEDHDFLGGTGDAALPGKPDRAGLRRNSRNARQTATDFSVEMVFPNLAADLPPSYSRVLSGGRHHAGRLCFWWTGDDVRSRLASRDHGLRSRSDAAQRTGEGRGKPDARSVVRPSHIVFGLSDDP